MEAMGFDESKLRECRRTQAEIHTESTPVELTVCCPPTQTSRVPVSPTTLNSAVPALQSGREGRHRERSIVTPPSSTCHLR